VPRCGVSEPGGGAGVVVVEEGVRSAVAKEKTTD